MWRLQLMYEIFQFSTKILYRPICRFKFRVEHTSPHFSPSLPALSSSFLRNAVSSWFFLPTFNVYNLLGLDCKAVLLCQPCHHLTFLWWPTFFSQFCLLKLEFDHFWGNRWQRNLTCIRILSAWFLGHGMGDRLPTWTSQTPKREH